MKKLLIMGLLVSLATGSTFAQAKKPTTPLTTTDSLVKNRKFVFVVTRLKQKPGYSSAVGFPLLSGGVSDINGVVTSVSQSQAITSIAVKDSWQQQIFYRNNGSQDYFDAYGIPTKRGKVDPVFNATANIFIIQYPDQLMIKDNPMSLNDIQTDPLSAFNTGNFEITEAKKKKGKWLLTYEVPNPETHTRKFYMEISDDGKAMFRTTPAANYTTYLYGFVLGTDQLKKQ